MIYSVKGTAKGVMKKYIVEAINEQAAKRIVEYAHSIEVDSVEPVGDEIDECINAMVKVLKADEFRDWLIDRWNYIEENDIYEFEDIMRLYLRG